MQKKNSTIDPRWIHVDHGMRNHQDPKAALQNTVAMAKAHNVETKEFALFNASNRHGPPVFYHRV